MTGLGARVALISVGAGNTYGHPATKTVELLGDSGVRVLRTDVDGSIALVGSRDGLGVVTGGPRAAQPR